MANKRKGEPKYEFITFLEENVDDRALMASLRRGLALPKGQSAEVSRVVQCWLSLDSPRWLEDAYYSVAPLFGLHHDEIADKGNMGAHFRELCPAGEEIPTNVERRFMQLLSSDANTLDDSLRQSISLLKSKEVGVNWQQLLDDVIAWKHTEERRDHVRLDWSRAFWRTEQENNQPKI
ncbi:MAG: type I-E CRISPR-associated protein Cse2/CasB [Chloroflexota bacterium]|nr:MAG: type I-E CRISPR-associated protein Cse2/CasB [Chloroflexota bacterium]